MLIEPKSYIAIRMRECFSSDEKETTRLLKGEIEKQSTNVRRQPAKSMLLMVKKKRVQIMQQFSRGLQF